MNQPPQMSSEYDHIPDGRMQQYPPYPGEESSQHPQYPGLMTGVSSFNQHYPEQPQRPVSGGSKLETKYSFGGHQ